MKFPPLTHHKLCKIERIGADAAGFCMDLYLQGKGQTKIVEEFAKYGHEITIDDVNTFINKYGRLKKKALEKSKACRRVVEQRRSQHQGRIDKLIDTLEVQLDAIKNGEMNETRRAGALTLIAKTIFDGIKTSSNLDGTNERISAGPTVNVGIVQQISKDKEHLRNEILKADFSTEPIEAQAEIVEGEVEEEFPEDPYAPPPKDEEEEQEEESTIA